MAATPPSDLNLVHDAVASHTAIDLREREGWLTGQRRAFEAALADASLTTSLGILAETASEMLGEGVRAAFHLADDTGRRLDHLVGMGDDFAEAVCGYEVGPKSVACGLASHLGAAVLMQT